VEAITLPTNKQTDIEKNMKLNIKSIIAQFSKATIAANTADSKAIENYTIAIMSAVNGLLGAGQNHKQVVISLWGETTKDSYARSILSKVMKADSDLLKAGKEAKILRDRPVGAGKGKVGRKVSFTASKGSKSKEAPFTVESLKERILAQFKGDAEAAQEFLAEVHDALAGE